MSAKKGDAERFAEFVGKLGVSRAQELLNVMRGFDNGGKERKQPTAERQRPSRGAGQPTPAEGKQQ